MDFAWWPFEVFIMAQLAGGLVVLVALTFLSMPAGRSAARDGDRAKILTLRRRPAPEQPEKLAA